MDRKLIALGVIGVCVIGVISFFAGMKYSQARTSPQEGQMFTGQFGNGQFPGRNGMNRQGGPTNGMGNSGGFLIGEVLSKDESGITVKLTDGGSKIVFLSSSTTVLKTAEGTLDDLTVGTAVSVQGAANSDGSVNAQSIQIRPAGFQMPTSR